MDLQPRGHGLGDPSPALVASTIDLGDKIQKMLPVDLCAKHTVGSGGGNDDPIEVLIVVLRIAQIFLHSRIVVRHSVEIRSRATRDPRTNQRISEKSASGPLATADQIR
jgi:hypothetical protein